MPCDSTCMWNLKDNVKEQTKEKQTHAHREQADACRGERGGWGKGAGLTNTGCGCSTVKGEVTCSTGNVTSNIVTTLYGVCLVGTGNTKGNIL